MVRKKAGVIWSYFYICIDNDSDMWYNADKLRKEINHNENPLDFPIGIKLMRLSTQFKLFILDGYIKLFILDEYKK